MGASGADLHLIFDVMGGGSVSGESGTRIHTQINRIANGLNSQKYINERRIIFDLDKAATRSALKASLDTVMKQVSGGKSFKVKIAKIDATSAIRDFQSKIQSVLSTLSVKNGMTVSVKDFTSGGKITGDAGGAKNIEEATARAQEYANQLKTIQSITRSLGSTQGSLVKINGADSDSILTITHRIEALNKQIQDYKNAKAPNQSFVDSVVRETAAINQEAEALRRSTKAKQDGKNAENAASATRERSIRELTQLRGLLEQVEHAHTSWTKAANDPKTSKAYQDLVPLAERINGAISGTNNESLSKLRDDFKAISSEIKGAGNATKSWGDRVGGLAKKFSEWFSLTRVIMSVYRGLKQMVSATIELDSALTQLKIVTGATDVQMSKFLTQSVSLAKELGKSVTDVVSSIEVFSRLGYDLNESSTLAKYAGILSNVAAVSQDEATTGLTSIIKGYNMDVENAEHVADVLVQVGQKYAVSASEMMEAYEKSGAALNATNTSFEKSAGLIAAANASVQDSSVVGTALKTVSARIRGSKTDLEELGEDTEELANGFSKYAEEIKALTGFDIMVDDSHFKDIYDIFDGISQAWDDLTDTQQARVSEILGGTRQLQVISSIIGNWGDAANAYADAMNAAGVATQANDTYLESVNGHIAQFKARFQEVSANLVDSGFVSEVVDFGTSLLNILDVVADLIHAVGGLNTVLTATVGIIVTANVRGIWNFLVGTYKTITSIIPAFKTLFSAIKKFKGVWDTINAGINSGTALAVPGVSRLSLAFSQLGISASVAQVAVGALFAALTIGVAVYNHHKQAVEEARQATEEAGRAYQEQANTIDGYKQKIIELKKVLDDESTSQEDAYQARLELMSIQDEVREAYGKEAEAIDLITQSSDNAVESLTGPTKKLAETKLAENKKSVEEAISEMEKERQYTVDVNKFNFGADPEARRRLDEIVNSFDNANLHKTITKDYSRLDLQITGTAEEAKETLVALSTAFDQAGKEFEIFKDIDFTKAIGNASKTLDTFQTNYENAIAWKIAADDKYDGWAAQIYDAKSKLTDAIAKDDYDSADAALAIISNVSKELAEHEWGEDQGVKTYLENLCAEIAGYNIVVPIRAQLKNADEPYRGNLVDAANAFADEDGAISLARIGNAGLDYTGDSRRGDLSEEEAAYYKLNGAATLYGVTVEDLIKAMSSLGYVTLSVGDAADDMGDSVSSGVSGVLGTVTTAEEQIGELGKVLGEFQENGYATAKSITGLKETFGGMKTFDEFARVMGDSSSSMEEAQAAANALGTEYVNTLGITGQLTEENAAMVVSLLEKIGVTNAELVVESALNDAKAQAWIESNNLTNATVDEINQKIKDIGVTDKLRQAIWNHKFANEAAKIATGNYNTTLTEQIGILSAVAAAAGLASDSLAGLSKMQALERRFSEGNATFYEVEHYDELMADYAKEAQSEFSELFSANVPITVDVKGVNGSGSSSKNSGTKTSTKEVEEYTAAIEKFRIEKERLADAQLREERLEQQLDNAKSLEEQIAVREQITQAIQDELDALHALNEARDEEMASGAEELRGLGFDVDFDKDTNKFFVNNAEHINDLISGDGSNQEATNNLRKHAEELIKEMEGYGDDADEASTQWLERYAEKLENLIGEYEDTTAALERSVDFAKTLFDNAVEQRDTAAVEGYANQQVALYRQLQDNVHAEAEALRGQNYSDDSEQIKSLQSLWWEYQEAIRETRGSVIDYLGDIKEASSSAVDEIQSVYSTLQTAADEYASNDGFISIDTYQEILNLAPKYLQMLTDESGLLVINRERIEEVTEARVRDMAAQAAYNYTERVKLALLGESDEKLSDILDVTVNSTDATWALVDANLALAKSMMTDSDYQKLLHGVEVYRSLEAGAVTGIGKETENFSELLDYVMDMMKQKVEDYIDSLEDMKDEYAEIISLRKEALDAAKEEEDYQDSVADKVKELAKLQNQINQLSLDDSREAQAKRASLEEEMAELQKDLNDTQRDHAIETQKESLDKMQEAYEEEKDAEIKAAQDSVSSYQKLYDLAMAYIQKNWNEDWGNLYDELLEE